VVLAKTFAAIRFDVDWDALDYVSRADEFDLPILLFHGDEDRTVPIESSEAFAEARPDIVQYVPFAGSSHVGGWNRDREKYESAVSSFLSQLVE
jgi:pimeloyl-ACP methyl ester carboxylesterase